MNDKELEEIRSRCEKATGGHWIAYIEGRDIECGSSFIQTASDDLEITGATNYDYDFIANARHDIITLLDKIENIHSKQYTLNDNELEKIRNRCEKATGEPWIVLVFDKDYIIQTAGEEDLEITGATNYDYDFIANTRHDIITLLDKIENIHSKQYTLNDNEFEKIRNRLEKANSELWIFQAENREIECGSERYWDFIKPIGKDFKIYGATVADYEFISHSRQDVVTLLDEIERLRSKEA